MIEDRLKEYMNKVQELKQLRQEIQEHIPNELALKEEQLALEVESDKSVLQKQIKDGGDTVIVDGTYFKVSTRSKSAVSEEFLPTAKDLGHLEYLVEVGVITDVKVNEDMIQRLDPELAGIYSNLMVQKPYKALSWPKKVDV